jgi:hypothetical protein
VPILDVVSEGFKADLSRLEADLRGAQEPPRIIDDPHHAQRGGLGATALPDRKRLECRDGTRQQRGGPVVGRPRAPGNQRGRNLRSRKRDGGCEACRAAADDDCPKRRSHHCGLPLRLSLVL